MNWGTVGWVVAAVILLILVGFIAAYLFNVPNFDTCIYQGHALNGTVIENFTLGNSDHTITVACKP